MGTRLPTCQLRGSASGTNCDSHFNRSLQKMEQGSGAAPGTIRPLVRSFGCAGFFVWLAIGAIFATFFIGEYLHRPDHQKSFWKAGVTVSFSKTGKISKIILFQGIWCIGSIFGTGAGITAFLFLIFNSIREKWE